MKSDIASLAQLLAQARSGGRPEMDCLLQRCRSYLGLVARAQVESWLQAKVDASDLVQQTLMEAYCGFARFRGTTEAEWLAWLRQILAHNAADFVRRYKGTLQRAYYRELRQATNTADSAPAKVWDPPDSIASPSQQLLQQERQLQLADALARLAPDYREVVMLRNLQRRPFEEVAQRMGRSRPAVQMLWMRAIRKLREEMGDR